MDKPRLKHPISVSAIKMGPHEDPRDPITVYFDMEALDEEDIALFLTYLKLTYKEISGGDELEIKSIVNIDT